jgi:prepilin-type N-terminal cleavage/methylation domain-containing protein
MTGCGENMRNRRGMTLVEVIVAMALFAIVMVTIFPAFIITNMMNNVSKEFMDANYYATEELEEIYHKGKSQNLAGIATWLGASRGFTCVVVSSVYECTKTANGVVYDMTLGMHTGLNDLVDVNITVEVTTGDYAGDRAEIQSFVRTYYNWGG